MMKKALSVSLLAAVALSGVAFAAEFEYPRMRNVGFEDGLVEWSVPPAGWRLSKGEGLGGSTALVWERGDGGLSQRLALESGVRYRFGAWVKHGAAGRKTDPKIALAWFSWQDKKLGETAASLVVDNNPHTGGWIRYEGLTPPVKGPYGDISVSIPEGAEGRVLFDDFTFFPEDGKPVGGIVSSAYRDEAAGGMVTFAVALNINTVMTPLVRLVPMFTFKGADGKPFTLRPEVFTADRATVPVETARLAMGCSQVAFTLTDDAGKPVGSVDMPFTRVSACQRRRVSVDAFNRTLVDGKSFFPLGMYAGRLTEEDIEIYRQGPFNCVLCYRPTDEAMELCHKAGILYIRNIKDIVPGSAWAVKQGMTKEESFAAIKRHVERVRNHPGMLAWYTCDEAPLSQVPVLSEVRHFLHDIDPDHPVYIVLDRPEHVRAFAPAFDVIGMDPYPIGNNRGDIEIAYGWAAAARTAMYGARPMWHVSQAYSWGWHEGRRKAAGDDPDLRFPTREEFMSMTWQPIAAGANGLIPYAFHAMRERAKGEEFAAIWKIVCDVMAEVKAHFDVLLSEPGPAVSDVPAGLVVRTWRNGGGAWVLACNVSRKDVKAKLRVDGRWCVSKSAIGNGATAHGTDVIDIAMPPIGVSLFALAERQ